MQVLAAAACPARVSLCHNKQDHHGAALGTGTQSWTLQGTLTVFEYTVIGTAATAQLQFQLQFQTGSAQRLSNRQGSQNLSLRITGNSF